MLRDKEEDRCIKVVDSFRYARPQLLVIDEVRYLSYPCLRRMRLTSTRIALALPAHVRDRDAPVRPHAARIVVSTAMGS